MNRSTKVRSSELISRPLLAGIMTLAALALSACGISHDPLQKNTRLESMDVVAAATSLSGEFCTMPAGSIKSNLKFIFVIDKSGSNQNSALAAGTDPNGIRRFSPIMSMLSQYAGDPSIYWSLITFSTSATVQKVGTASFTNDKTAFETLVYKSWDPANNRLRNPPLPTLPADGGWTNFTSALTATKNVIDADIASAKASIEKKSSYYVVFFISDGAPYISQDSVQPKSDITNMIDSMVGLQEANKDYVDAVQVHSGFYFMTAPTDSLELEKHRQASSYMSDMAVRGAGDFYQFADGDLIDFSRFTLPERRVKHTLRDVFVTNQSSSWWQVSDMTSTPGAEGVNLYGDTDADGLPDLMETKLGSNPDAKDSDGNGVSDYVEYFATKAPCKDARCAASLAEPFAACAGYAVAPSTPGQTIFKDSDKDGLNDCEEEVVLKSRADNFDTNSDWIPDELAMRWSTSFIGGNGEALLDPDNDSVTNYSELKLNTPVNFPNDKLTGFEPMRYELKVISNTPSQTCYALDVARIKTKTKVSQIKIYVLENTSVVDNKRFMRSATLSIPSGSVGKFADTDLH